MPDVPIVAVIAIVGTILVLADAILIRRRIAARVMALQGPMDTVAATIASLASGGNAEALAILDQLPYPLIVHDRTGRVIYLTPQAAAIIGRPPERIIGTTYLERNDNQDGLRTFHEFRSLVVLDRKTHEGEISYLSPGDLVRRRYTFRVSPFFRGEVVYGTVAIFQDISASYISRFS